MESQKTKIISVVAIVALALTVITATYAYFNANVGDPAAADIRINANTVDTFTFATGNQITFNLDQESFASGKGNIAGNTYASAMLTANNKTNTATEHYYLYLNIENNSFTYSINTNTPEIIMTITDNAGTEVKDISTLNHVIVTGANGTQVSGYDITNKSGLITLFNNREITTTSSKEEKWNITITFVNYDASQNTNAGKSMNAKVMIQKEKINAYISDVCSNNDNLSNCLTTLGNIGDLKFTNIYYHNASLTNGAGDNSYRYAGGDYVLTAAGKATGATMMIGYDKTVTKALIDFYCNGTKQYVGYGCDTSQTHYYIIKGDTAQYKTYKETLNRAVEKGYLTKDHINNFLCFGSNESPCPTENLYRIIGVFNEKVSENETEQRIKLIKWNYAKSSLLGTDGDFSQEYSYFFSGKQEESPINNSHYYWNGSTKINSWSASELNTINLNTNFITNIGEEWANKIATTTWKVGGNTSANIAESPMYRVYQNEITNPEPGDFLRIGGINCEAQIGLMYVSDYGYAASPSAWTLVGNNSDATKDYRFSKGENWLYGGGWEWTITRNADNSRAAFSMDYLCFVNNYNVGNDAGVRPSFNLLSSTIYVSGSGTSSDPIRIN